MLGNAQYRLHICLSITATGICRGQGLQGSPCQPRQVLGIRSVAALMFCRANCSPLVLSCLALLDNPAKATCADHLIRTIRRRCLPELCHYRGAFFHLVGRCLSALLCSTVRTACSIASRYSRVASQRTNSCGCPIELGAGLPGLPAQGLHVSLHICVVFDRRTRTCPSPEPPEVEPRLPSNGSLVQR